MKEKTKIDKQEIRVDPLMTDMAHTYMNGLRLAAEVGSISCVMIQRRLGVGYALAFRILEWMVEQGFVQNGGKGQIVKQTLITLDEYEHFRKCIEIPVKKPNFEIEKESVFATEIDEELYKSALRLIVEMGRVSTSLIQRKLSVGFLKAATMIKLMETDGFVSPFSETKGREVLITKKIFKQRYGEDL